MQRGKDAVILNIIIQFLFTMKKFFAIIATALFISFTANAQEGIQKVTVNLKNNSALPRKFMVITYQPSNNGSNCTNGMLLMPTFSKAFEVEVGTRFFIADSRQVNTVMGGQKLSGTPFLTVKAEDAGKTFDLNK
jgi:hypothetical protein